ncbi:MAG: hypothetical protein UDK34_00380 [Cyanobacteriota bacterium]|nr:hypothetical protein [Cyanobacteriota bacterium]
MIKITDGFRHISDVSRYNYNAMNKKIRTSFKSTPIPTFHSEKPNFATRIVKFFKALFYANK